jgi:hypothetical protein
LDKNADINIKDNDGNTALIWGILKDEKLFYFYNYSDSF